MNMLLYWVGRLVWSENDSEDVLSKLESAFIQTPHRFFTEHDLHSHLYHLVETKLADRGELFCVTADGEKVSLVHHEYPTPFRCDMCKHGFKLAEESDRTPKGGLYKRGHYDLVVLNPDFVRKNSLAIVSGKQYSVFKSAKKKIDVTPLLWACEILFGAHAKIPALPNEWIDLVTQDAQKIIQTLRSEVGNGVKFLASGDVSVFLGIGSNEKTKKMKERIQEFEREKMFKIHFVTTN